MYIFVSVAFAVLYVIVLIYWDKKIKWRLPKKAANALGLVHIASLAITLIVAILYSQFEIGLRGLWTTRVFIIIFLISGIFFRFLVSKEGMKNFAGWYFKAFSFLPIAVAAILCIPFLGIVLVLSLLGRLVDPATDIFYEDSKIRVQLTFIGALGPPTTDIYEKRGIFEKHLKRKEACAIHTDSVKVTYGNEFTKVVLYDSEYRSEPCEINFEKIK